MRRSILAPLVLLASACAPPKSGQVQNSVSNQKITSAAVTWSPTLPCAVAVVGEPQHVETICCAPKATGSTEWSCTMSAPPSPVASSTKSP